MQFFAMRGLRAAYAGKIEAQEAQKASAEGNFASADYSQSRETQRRQFEPTNFE